MEHVAAITLNALKTGYKERGTRHIVSEGLTASLPLGVLTMLMGPNGSGKSTLLQTLSGLLAPIGGCGMILQHDLSKLNERERAQLMSLVLTDRVNVAGLSVWDLIAIGRYPYIGLRGKLQAEDREIIQRAISDCGLCGYEQREYLRLSDGEKQRVMIARALTQETPIILLDEPTAHLDLPSRVDIIRMLADLAHQHNKCILVSTHELELSLRLGDHIWLMNRHGELEAGSPDELIRRESFERCFGRAYIDLDYFRKFNDNISAAPRS